MSRRHEERRHRRRTEASGASDDRRGYSRRYTRRYGDATSGEQDDRNTGGRTPGRAHDGRRRGGKHRSRGNPRRGSQRGEDSVQGVSGRVGRQFGDLHGPRPSEGEAEGFHGEEQFAGDAGRSARDRRFGSRRGHGSQRREDRRTDRGR